MRLRRLEPMLRRALDGGCRLPGSARLLVAVSGGADSTALLLALRSLTVERGLELHAAHLNHRLRGSDADRDQAFVERLCARLRVPLHVARWDTRARMRRRSLSGENGLRILRREFLESVARRIGANAIATAHTADDQLETVLLRLLRGSGLRGLGGMRPRQGLWIKPLLGATGEDIDRDLRAARQPWREDASNAGLGPLRNRIRHRVVPALLEALSTERSASPTRRAALARRVAMLAAELRSAERALVRQAQPIARRAAPLERGGFVLPLRDTASLPRAARRVLLRRLWRRSSPAGPGLTETHLGLIDRLLAGGSGPVGLPGGFEASRRAGALRVEPAGSRSFSGRWASNAPTPLPVPGCAEPRGLRVTARWTSARAAARRISEKPGREEYFAEDGLRGRLEVRPARADETFVPMGLERPVRLLEFLSKLPARHHASSPTVLADDSGILWVIGLRRSARATVRPTTRRVLCVHAERHD